ncbi:MAG: hypothetical protein A7315_04260 [Candidatus Altiarchaeales archaeon WOR_SM1_79]|nr:MAG: hypothetical protein A7315_04260 [Candidatus Altiarchaeales archaeon WOR_SM1_79]
MINLLELFGAGLAIMLAYIIVREKNYKLLLFGITLLPFGVVWESLRVDKAWVYTTPPDVVYSIYLTESIPLIIPIGWSLCMMVLFYIGGRLMKVLHINKVVLFFLIGTIWGLIFELVFVNLGYWQYLMYPQVANLRPSVPTGWGILTVSLILTFEFLWARFGNDLRTRPYYILLFFLIYFLITPVLLIIAGFSFLVLDPLCVATICK